MSKFLFYHGTHSGNLDGILRNGLTPQANPVSAMWGNQSTIPGYTEHLVFLTPSLIEAGFYAKAQAEKCGTQPIIFRVTVNDATRLCVSDDYIAVFALKAMLKSSSLPDLEFDDDGDVHQYGKSSEAYYLWRQVLDASSAALTKGEKVSLQEALAAAGMEIDDLDNIDQGAIADQVWTAMYSAWAEALEHPWQAAIADDRDPAVGYRGIICPDQLQAVDRKKVDQAIKNCHRGFGIPMQWGIALPNDQDESDHNECPAPAM
jgi:hypothetical protein